MQFNDTTDDRADRTRSTNHEGGRSYDPATPELELTKNVLTNLLDDSYYESAEESYEDVLDAFDRCADTSPEFPLKLASYARQEENLRQVPQLLLVLSANHNDASEHVREYATSIMARADEPLEALAMQVSLYGKSIPEPLLDGIEDALHTFDEYQFAKWDRPSREWQYRDLLNLVHPNPRDDERDRIFEKIAYGELDDHDVDALSQEGTWEDAQSAAGEDEGADSAAVWREQLREDEDGYSMPIFARIRNVRNMLEDGLTGEEIFGDECGPAVTDEWVRNSGLYPFRFYQAVKAVRESREAPNDEYALDWLEHAIDVSAENLPDSFDDTLAVVDTSGSMQSAVSRNSSLLASEIASLFGAVMLKRNCDVLAFASEVQELRADSRDTVTTLSDQIRDCPVGGATYGHLVPEHLVEQNEPYENVVVFTDQQLYSRGPASSFEQSWNQYTQSIAPDASLYVVDLQHYGDLTMSEGSEGVYNIQGWSSNVLDFIDTMESAGELVSEIEAYEP